MQKYKVTKSFNKAGSVTIECHKIGKYYYPVSEFNERGLLKPGSKPVQATWGHHLISERL